jgi:hypothetical protein
MAKIFSGHDLLDLKKKVVEHFGASNWRELGAITNTMDDVERHPRLLRSLSFGDEDYDGLSLTFLRKMIGRNQENLDVVLDYVARVSGSAGENVSTAPVIQDRKIVFSPEIFQIPNDGVDETLVSVMMPFGAHMNPVYSAIKFAATQCDLVCKRADDIWDHSTVIQDIFSLIFKSTIVVCDFTGKNPNVFYEAGIAHTLGKHVVPITQHQQDIPFDLSHHRYAIYLNNGEGLQQLTMDLSKRFKALVGDKAPSWSW